VSAHRPRILVIDDEPQIHRFLGPALDASGYEPVRADDAASGLREIARKPPDAVVLDLGLPDMDGKEALARARAFYDGPVIILSARDRETEKIDALDAGADDYVEKPFGVGELLARLRVALRHRLMRDGAAPVITSGDLELDLVNRRVTLAGQPVRLSPKEYDLLAGLAEGRGRVLTHRQLLTAVWGPAHAHDVQYLRVFIGQLRQKLEADPAAPRLILTEPGVGYRFQEDDGAAQSAAAT
jgi:two-component system, OmpR family, KDP operon response regulator KdpE